jgi:CubicO group peptidase (beta-lactamase class C family)
MELDEQNDINPDLTTRFYAPEIPVHHTHTLAELASNRGGVGHYDELGLGTVNTQYDTALEAGELFWDEPLLSEPGTDYHYSTHGYTLLGAGIEGATGDPIGDVINDEFTVGLNLPTLRVEDRSQPNSFRATLYNNNNTEATPDNISWKVLGGGLEASAYDLVRFGMKLMNGQILSSASLDELWTVPEPDNVAYALGWNIGTQQGARVAGKDGVQRGANTYLRLFPELDLAIVVLSNRSGGGHNAGTLARDIADVILPTIPHLDGDYNWDNVVDIKDYNQWRESLGDQIDLRADGDGNGVVGQGDYQIWKTNFGRTLFRRTLEPAPSDSLANIDRLSGAEVFAPISGLGLVANPIRSIDASIDAAFAQLATAPSFGVASTVDEHLVEHIAEKGAEEASDQSLLLALETVPAPQRRFTAGGESVDDREPTVSHQLSALGWRNLVSGPLVSQSRRESPGPARLT